MIVRDLMEQCVFTVDSEMAIPDLERQLTSLKVHGVPVVSKTGKLMGVISKTDLVRLHSERKRASRAVGGSAEPPKVWEVFSTPPITISPDETVTAAARSMLESEVHRLVVMEDDEIVGILSTFDVLRYITEGPSPESS